MQASTALHTTMLLAILSGLTFTTAAMLMRIGRQELLVHRVMVALVMLSGTLDDATGEKGPLKFLSAATPQPHAGRTLRLQRQGRPPISGGQAEADPDRRGQHWTGA